MTDTGWPVRVPAEEESSRSLRRRVVGQTGLRSRLLILSLAVIVVAAFVDTSVGRGGSSLVAASSETSDASVAASMVAPAGSESSAWFCPGGTSSPSTSPAVLELTNSGAKEVTGILTTDVQGAATRSVPIRVGPYSQVAVNPAGSGMSAWEAATVVLDGGEVAVSEVLANSLGWSSTGCSSSTSSNWYFAHGSTASGAALALWLYNPSTTEAVANVAFDTSTSGVVEPPAYEGVPVPPGGVLVDDVGDHVMNDPQIATVVSTSSGNVVAAQLQSTPLSAGGGSSLLLGVQAPAAHWNFPETVDPVGGSVVFHVFNPSNEKARVSVRVGLAEANAEPITIVVPPESTKDVVAEQQTRFPPSSSYDATFDALEGASVVVDREIASPKQSPGPQVGLVAGVPGGASRTLVPAVSKGAAAAALSISDVSSVPATVTVATVGTQRPLAGLRGRVVLPGRALVISPSAVPDLGTEPLIVSSSAAVAVELDATPGALGTVVFPSFALP